MNGPEIISTWDLCDISGMSYRRLDCYCRAGVFGRKNQHPGSGGRRRFEMEDVLIAMALAKVADLGGVLSNSAPMVSHKLALRIADAVRYGTGRYLVLEPTGEALLRDEVEMSGALIVVDLSSLGANLLAVA